MPYKPIADTFTAEEIAKLGGLQAAYGYFLAKAWNTDLKFIHNGRRNVVSIEQQKPIEVPNQEGSYTLALHVRYWLAEPADAGVGDYVYERSLRANGEVHPVTEAPMASFHGKQFVRTNDGWWMIE